MHSIDDGTIGGLMMYLDDLIANNRAEASRITPLKSAVKRVFSGVEMSEWKFLKADEVDTNELIERFKYFCKSAEFNEDTFAAYRARINRAIKWYKSYLENHEWSPFKKETALEVLLNSYIHAGGGVGGDNQSVTGMQMVTYPFPLSDGSLASLRLPKNLSNIDGERLKTFISSLVTEGR